jgi:hypothetical protein
MLMADFEEFTTLQFILGNARWAGAPSEAEATREYFRARMWDGVRRLGHSADLLGEVLVEIIEEMEDVGRASQSKGTKRNGLERDDETTGWRG